MPTADLYGSYSVILEQLWGKTQQLPNSYPTVSEQVEKIVGIIADRTLSTKEIMDLIGLKDKGNLLELYLYPAIRQELVVPLYPDKPNHPRQKYRLTDKGKGLLQQ
jgi:ATP-dependent DNA helicase RecG